MKTFRTLALIAFAALATQVALLQTALATSKGAEPTTTTAQQTAAAQEPPAAQQWEFTPYNQLNHLRARDFRTAIIPYQKTQELREASQILVDTSMLLRPPPPFTVEVSPDEPLEDVLNRIMPEIRLAMRTQTPFVIVIKRDSIQRLMVLKPREGESVTAKQVKNTRISPGDIIVLDIVGY